MSTTYSKEQRVKLLRYGEILARKARNEATETELSEMENIRKEFLLTPEQMVSEVETLVKSNY